MPTTRSASSAALLIAVCLAVSGCGKPMPVSRFAATSPGFDPLSFWTGHTRSWGVVENRDGAPTETVITDCIGEAEGTNGLHMRQTLTESDGTVAHRDWHLRRLGGGRFTATANDMVGTAEGEAAGRAFHWTWIWARTPGKPLGNVTMSQWMYAMPGDRLMNHTTIFKFGVVVAQVSEEFGRMSVGGGEQ